MGISFRDHEGFHRAAIAMTAAGAAGGAIGAVAGWSPAVGGALGAAVGAAIVDGRDLRPAGSAAGGWGGSIERRRRAGRIGLALVVVAMGAGIARAIDGAAAGWILAAAVAIAIARGRGARRWLGAAAIATAVAAIGAHTAARVAGAAVTASWPAWITAAVAAAAMALVAVAALVAPRVAIERDPVAAALRQLPTAVDAEVRDLAEQGASVWAEVKARVSDDAGRTMVRDGVLRLVEVAARSERIPRDVAADRAKVAARIDDLDGRIAAATDEIARAEYAAARAALDDQRRYLDGIAVSRDRLVARMHGYLAALEKYRLCVIHVETASTADLELSGRALAELDAA